MLKIINAPNPILSQSAKQISKIDTKILKFIEEMKKSLLAAKDPIGVGLAAPQVGSLLQLFIAKPTSKSEIQVFINPKIVNIEAGGERGGPRRAPAGSASSEDVGRGQSETGPATKTHTKLEGCLSLPNIWGNVQRLPEITLSYLDEKGTLHKRVFRNFIATIIQHEMDHLNGILFPKRVLEQKGTLYRSHKDKKGEDVFEEIEL